MLDYETFVARHGEVGAQALLENIERFENIRHETILPLQVRWEKVMRGARFLAQAA